MREESPPAGGDGATPRIFFPHPVAQRTTQWERGDEPMTQFAFTDDYDDFGQPRRQVEPGRAARPRLPRRRAAPERRISGRS